MTKRPVDHVPNVPAWTTTDVPQETCFSIIGVQARPGADPAAALDWLRVVLTTAADAPDHLERARVLNDPHAATTVFLAYWLDPARYDSWRVRPEVVAAFAGAASVPGVGAFEETAKIPADRWETLHSTDEPTPGVRNLLPVELTDIHEYWGAARDRIASSAVSSLEHLPVRDGLPGNLCLIRSGQVWAHCGEAERRIYLTTVEPTLRAAVEFLDRHPDTGCWSSRYLREQTVAGDDLESTSFVGWFRSLADLEAWSESHPTHLAIFAAFMDLAARMRGEVELRLWHEVSVLPEEAVQVSYTDCSPTASARPLHGAASEPIATTT